MTSLRQYFNKTAIPPVWGDADDKYKNNHKSFTNLVPLVKFCNFFKDGTKAFRIDLLPLEILYIIIEKLDPHTFANCFHVSKKWKSIIISIANADKTNVRWQSIFELHHEEETFKVKSCNLSYKELFVNSLCWNLDLSFSLYGTCSLQHVKKINIYRDNIIVIDYDGVKYFDVHTHDIKKNLQISECFDFNERDAFVLRGTQVQNNDAALVKLFLYGKKDPNDDEYHFAVERIMNYGDHGLNHNNSLIVGGVNEYVIENNCCYVMNTFSNILACYIWKDQIWEVRNLGRFYGNRDDIVYAMSVLSSEVFLLIKWGQVIHYCYEKKNFQEVCRVRMPVNKNVFVRMVHKYCLVMGVPSDCEFRITRTRNNDGYIFYRLECPKLTCVTQHGEMLFLGFSDGKIELFMPQALSRKDMLKRRIYISDFISDEIEPEDLIVVSIDVFEDLEQHYLFIATHSCVYQLLVTHEDSSSVWDNIPEPILYYKYPIRTRYAL